MDALTQIQNYLQTEFALLGVGLDKASAHTNRGQQIMESAPISVQDHHHFDDALFRTIAEDFLSRVAAADTLIAALPNDQSLLNEAMQVRQIETLQRENDEALEELCATIAEAKECQQAITGAVLELSRDKLRSQEQRLALLDAPPTVDSVHSAQVPVSGSPSPSSCPVDSMISGHKHR